MWPTVATGRPLTTTSTQRQRRAFTPLRTSWLRVAPAWAIRSRLEPVKKVARMIRRHWEGVINAVMTDLTNARSEGINAKIQWIKQQACGYRNRGTVPVRHLLPSGRTRPLSGRAVRPHKFLKRHKKRQSPGVLDNAREEVKSHHYSPP